MESGAVLQSSKEQTGSRGEERRGNDGRKPGANSLGMLGGSSSGEDGQAGSRVRTPKVSHGICKPQQVQATAGAGQVQNAYRMRHYRATAGASQVQNGFASALCRNEATAGASQVQNACKHYAGQVQRASAKKAIWQSKAPLGVP
eukprot:scaffold19074_cov21-Tisochrysis_lutea.AAC.1